MLLENQGAKHCQRFQIRGGKTLKSFQFSGALIDARSGGGQNLEFGMLNFGFGSATQIISSE